jgi:hypothetical protein
MKLNYEQVVLTLEGTPYKNEVNDNMTLKSAIIMACSTPLPGDEGLDAVKKYKVGEIAFLVHKGLDLTTEQVAIVKERIAKGFQSPTLVFLLHELLEGGAAA